MRKLNRPLAPSCLQSLKISSPTSWNLSEQDKELIWQSLNAMQNFFCVYCEGAFIDKKCHIEHLVPRHILKKIKGRSIYEWDNLFGSCDNKEHCGRYKDDVVTDYDPQNLIKPDIEDSSLYLSFSPTGYVQGKSDLDESDSKKACETIRVLNLDSPRLRNLRAKKIAEYQMQYIAIVELIQSSLDNPEDTKYLGEQMADLKNAIVNDEYYTAVIQNTLG